MQRISQSLTGNYALSWLLKMPSIKKKMSSLSTNQRSVILPFIDKLYYHARLNTNYHVLLIDVVVLSLYLFGSEIYIALLLLLYF